MSGLIAPAWTALVVIGAWRFRPGPAPLRLVSRSGRPTPARSGSNTGVSGCGLLSTGARSGMGRLGALVSSRISILQGVEPVRLGSATTLVVVTAVTSPEGALLLAGGLVGWFVFSERRRKAMATVRLLDELSAVVEILRVAVGGGLGVRSAFEVTVANTPADRDAGLGRVVEELDRGAVLDSALDVWASRVGQPASELSVILKSADRHGVAIGDALEHLAADLRRRRRRQAEERARRLPVTMLVPLVICVLPAFVLVTVVPMLVVGIDGVINAP